MYRKFINSKIGILEIVCNENYLLEINLVSKKDLDNGNVLCDLVHYQLNEYFNQKLTEFSLPISLSGTDFQNTVWNEVLKIPFGELISYQELANRIGKPKAVRAVANAIGKNKLLIVVPCHRVIGTDRKITGFSAGLINKIYLLRHEGKEVEEKKILKQSLVK